MFGITAFAQSPFAALGGTVFGVDLAESFTSTDVYAGPVAFSGIFADSFAITDDVPNAFNFFLNIVENYSAEETVGSIGVYDLGLAESFTTTDDFILSLLYFLNLAKIFKEEEGLVFLDVFPDSLSAISCSLFPLTDIVAFIFLFSNFCFAKLIS